MMNENICVMVAELSVIKVVRLAVLGLQKNSDVTQIDIVIPDRQYCAFGEVLENLKVNLIKESDLIGDGDRELIKNKLLHMNIDMAGIYNNS